MIVLTLSTNAFLTNEHVRAATILAYELIGQKSRFSKMTLGFYFPEKNVSFL